MIKNKKGNLIFTKEEFIDTIYEGNDNFDIISEEIIDFDEDKNSITKRVIIQELSTKKYYSADLYEGPWVKATEYNSKVEWKEVKPKEVLITKYE